MAKSIPAIITPEVLQWARNLDMIHIDEVSLKLKVKPYKVEAWESGSEYPSLNQAKQLAKQYRIPFAYLYLPDMPKKVKRLEKCDYRTFNNVGCTVSMSRELRWFLRDIEERRDTIFELYSGNEIVPKSIFSNLTLKSKDIEIATAIRALLDLTPEKQVRFRKPDEALSYCISKLEENDILIFQSSKIDPCEMRGLSVAYKNFPIIALNRKDEVSARLFTLFHELVHILTNSSGICNNISEGDNTPNAIELFCNRIAGYALVPSDVLEQNKHVLLIRQQGLNDTYVNAIARDFAVSKEVIINRLWNIGVIEKNTYFDTLKKYTKEYLSYKRQKNNDGFLPPALDKGTQVGKLYARTVIAAYHSEKISPLEASGYLLGLHLQHFSRIERWCF
jgi:Zn-dependent peptidase ImmA (M78 family)